MITTFKAAVCVAQVIDGVMIIGFADDAHMANEYLLLQKSCAPDSQDRDLGHDQVHISFNDQSRSAYGGICQAVLKEGCVDFHLTPSTAQALGTAPNLEVTFTSSSVTMTALREGLEQMFTDEQGILTCRIEFQG